MRRMMILPVGAALATASPFAAPAAELVPHEAVYDLSLASQTDELLGVDGRIALRLTVEECGSYDLDYRFVARFRQDGEFTLSDQRTLAEEAVDGARYEFETTTFLDGNEQNRIAGTATNRDDETAVTMSAPVERSYSLPASMFPLQHTRNIIDKAREGARIVETPLFDGDEEAEKLLTTTAIILPLESETVEESVGEAEQEAGALRAIQDLAGWRVDESYFNADSDADGMPIFRTRYTLYENGVTDRLELDFGNYVLEGRLSELTLLDAPAECR